MTALTFHPAAQADILKIVEYYRSVASINVAADFYRELRLAFRRVLESPETYAIRSDGRRRAKVARFPYHFLFRVDGREVFILVVRHDHRHPAFGASRR